MFLKEVVLGIRSIAHCFGLIGLRSNRILLKRRGVVEDHLRLIVYASSVNSAHTLHLLVAGIPMLLLLYIHIPAPFPPISMCRAPPC